jgi:hypothetical protein
LAWSDHGYMPFHGHLLRFGNYDNLQSHGLARSKVLRQFRVQQELLRSLRNLVAAPTGACSLPIGNHQFSVGFHGQVHTAENVGQPGNQPSSQRFLDTQDAALGCPGARYERREDTRLRGR